MQPEKLKLFQRIRVQTDTMVNDIKGANCCHLGRLGLIEKGKSHARLTFRGGMKIGSRSGKSKKKKGKKTHTREQQKSLSGENSVLWLNRNGFSQEKKDKNARKEWLEVKFTMQ